MAIDTALKRFSAINPANPWRGILPIPDGTVGAADRQIVALLYSGILVAGAQAELAASTCASFPWVMYGGR